MAVPKHIVAIYLALSAKFFSQKNPLKSIRGHLLVCCSIYLDHNSSHAWIFTSSMMHSKRHFEFTSSVLAKTTLVATS
jgi:hypothetical protein